MHTEMLALRFSPDVVDQPIIYRLVKDYDLEFNLPSGEVSGANL